MDTDNIITVEFKETYMDHSVRRACIGMTKQQIIDQYHLYDSDIEYFKWIED